MKVKILIEFVVAYATDDDGDEDEQVAKSAASVAAWQHLALTKSGQSVSDAVTVHVDGYGECTVRIGEDHEE